MRPTRPAAHGSSDVSALIEAEERRLQPWGYLYGLIWPSHTETIHSHLLLSSVTRVPLSKRETQRDVNRLERCIVHLQDECKLSLICEYMRHSHSVKTCSPLGPRLSRCHLAWALAALLRPTGLISLYRVPPLHPDERGHKDIRKTVMCAMVRVAVGYRPG